MSEAEKSMLHVTIELMWEKADTDKSGDLSKEEFMASWLNDVVTPESVINGCKTKGSNELTKEQATKCMANNLKGAEQQWKDFGTKWMAAIFDKLDTDHDGKLSKKEIEDGFQKLKEEEEEAEKKKHEMKEKNSKNKDKK